MITTMALVSKHVIDKVDISGIQISDEVCCVSGEVKPCVPKKDLISSSFTDMQYFKAPTSAWIGTDVYAAWRYGTREPGKKRDFVPTRNCCWYVDQNEFRIKLNKKDIRDIALKGGAPPWACWVTTSYKKHGTMRARPNNFMHGIIAFDDLQVDCSDVARTKEIYDRLCGMQLKGFSRPILESLSCPPGVLKKNGFVEWNEFYSWAKPFYTSALYQFCCYILPTADEIKEKKLAESEIMVKASPPKKIVSFEVGEQMELF